MKKIFVLAALVVAVVFVAACGGGEEAPALPGHPVNPPAPKTPTVHITVIDGSVELSGLQPVYNFSLSGYCETQIEEGGVEKLCYPIVKIETADVGVIFSGAPGVVTTIPTVILDDFLNVKEVVIAEVTYIVTAVEETSTGLALRLAPAP